jgi:hypothetical protein
MSWCNPSERESSIIKFMDQEPKTRSSEFDRSEWPELVSCKVMPGSEDETTEVELTDAEGKTLVIKVPSQAVRMVNVGAIARMAKEQVLPADFTSALQNDIGLGLLACRIAEQFDNKGLVKVQVPTESEQNTVLVREKQLARKV